MKEAHIAKQTGKTAGGVEGCTAGMGEGRQGNIEKSLRTLWEEEMQMQAGCFTGTILLSCSYNQRQNQVVLSAQKADAQSLAGF